MSRLASLVVLIAIIVLFGLLFYRVMVGFFVPLFLAVLLVVVFRPLHNWILEKLQGRERLAAGLTTGAIMFVVLAPSAWIGTLGLVQGVSLVAEFDTGRFERRAEALRESFGLELPLADRMHAIEDQLGRLSDAADKSVGDATYQTTLDGLLARIDGLRADITALSEGAEVEGNEVEVPLARAEKALANVDWLHDSIRKLSDNQLSPVDAEFAASLREASFAFEQVRNDLVGGPILGALTDLANPSDEEIHTLRSASYKRGRDYVVSLSGTATAFLLELLLGACIMVLGVYYFLVDGPAMLSGVMRLSPLKDRYETELLQEFDRMSRAVVLATLLTALVQGILAGIGFYLAGTGSVVLLMLLTMALALIPFIGAAAVWFPVGLWLLLIDNRPGAAIFIFAYGALVVSLSDNVIKPFVLHGKSNMHPLVALLSVIGGVQALGPIGILIGPMIVAFLQALLNILHTELGVDDDPDEADTTDHEAPQPAVNGENSSNDSPDAQVDLDPVGQANTIEDTKQTPRGETQSAGETKQ
jgi:predicted PurR-regulated permease PerM